MPWNHRPKILLSPNSPLPDSEEYLTVLKSRNKCCKTIKPKWDIESYGKHFKFLFSKTSFTTLDQLKEIIEDLSHRAYFLLVLGAPTKYVLNNPDEAHRRLANSREDAPATLEKRKTSFMALDIDALVIPGLTFDQFGATAVRDKLVELGLTELEDTRLIYQWTSKAGKNNNEARIRLFGMFQTQISFKQMKKWAEQAAIVDTKLFEPQQPIYIANPEFVNGAVDPIPPKERVGIIPGEFEYVDVEPDTRLDDQPNDPHPEIPETALQDNPFLVVMQEMGLIKRLNRPGIWDITCPWLEEHTDQEDSGTAFFEIGYDNRQNNGFKCHHNSCDGRDISDLTEKLAENRLLQPDYEPEPPEDIDQYDGRMNTLVKRYILLNKPRVFLDTLCEDTLPIKAIGDQWNHIQREPKADTRLIRDPRLVRVHDVTFAPGLPKYLDHKNTLHYNLWTKPEVITVEGDITPWLDHAKYLLPIKKDREHILNWMKFVVQHPDKKINHGILLGSDPRTGKDTLLEPLRYAVGKAYASDIPAQELTEVYTDFLLKTKLAIFQECQNFDKMSIENKLKPILASPPEFLRVRMFGAGFQEIFNVICSIFLSNHKDSMTISLGDGRYHANWSYAAPQPQEYYDMMYDWLRGDQGLEKVAHWLLNDPIDPGFDNTKPAPMTEYKEELQDYSLTDLAGTIRRLIEIRSAPFHKDIINPQMILESGVLDGYPTDVTVKKLNKAFNDLGYPRLRRVDPQGINYDMRVVRNKKQWMDEPPKKWFEELGV